MKDRVVDTEAGRTASMNKSSISQLLDGAAFPVLMLAIAVSQMKVGPHRRDGLRQGRGVGVELRADDPAQQPVKDGQAH